MNLTEQQEAIYCSVATDSCHVVVEALAGTGKTTTAVGCLSQLTLAKTGFVAFNQHIAAELQSRLPAGVRACTLHSLGLAACRKLWRVELEEAKLRRLSKELGCNLYPGERIAAEQLCHLAKYTLALEEEMDDATAFGQLADHFGVELPRNPGNTFTLARAIYDRSAVDLRTVDFDDMIWLPVKLGLRPDQFDLLVADEAQDFNRCQQELAKSAAADGRLVPIGDRNQSIYGFTGSDCDALPRLSRQLSGNYRGCRALPLTITWRCPTSHVSLARRIVPALEAAPNAADGTIRIASCGEIRHAVQPGDLVIARRNAPLVGMTYKLVLAGVKAVLRGRDIGKGLLDLIARLKPVNIADLLVKLAQFEETEKKRLILRDASAAAFQKLEDKCECLGLLASQADSVDGIEKFIRSVFDDTRNGESVVLSSVHRAKGLEADRVFVLDTECLPMHRREQQQWEKVQEENLCYVAVTRSKRELIFEDQVPPIFDWS